MDKQYSDRFLNAFSVIEKRLQQVSGLERFKSFDQHLKKAADRRGPVRFYRHDLQEYADLRNAIVHEPRGSDGKAIAEPHPETVTSIEAIKEKLLRPPELIPDFRNDVETCRPEDSVGLAAKKMINGDFSQLPVYENGRFTGLLTAETIARWLASCLDNGAGILEEESVEAVLKHTEYPKNYVLLSRNDTVFQAIEIFQEYSLEGKLLAAIVITHNGKETEAPLGIVTASDMPKLLSMVDIKRKM